VELLLNAGDPEAAGFFLQQAVEKFLKLDPQVFSG